MFKDIAHRFAARYDLNPDLVIAIIQIESAGKPYVVRYEPKWTYLLLPSQYAKRCGITFDTEVLLQSMSWGLMQIMGSVAREFGFDDMLTRLVDPELNVYMGCRKLSQLHNRYQSEPDIIAAYNAGLARKMGSGEYFNQGYVSKVQDQLKIIRGE